MSSPPSCGAAFITVVQPTDFRNGDDLASWHDGPPVGGVLGQGQVRSGAMIVSEMAFQQATKVPRIQNHYMIQAFTTNRADQSFCEGILPGGLRGAVTTSFIAKEWMRRRNSLP